MTSGFQGKERTDPIEVKMNVSQHVWSQGNVTTSAGKPSVP